MNENAWETKLRYFSIKVHILPNRMVCVCVCVAGLSDDSLLQMLFYITNSTRKNSDFVSSKAVTMKKKRSFFQHGNLFRSENRRMGFCLTHSQR